MTAGSAARYREMDVLSMSPARRVVLLYTHLLSNLQQAKVAIEQKNVDLRVQRLGKAHAILEELLYTLDPDAGGELASNLAGLYEFFMAEVLRHQRTPDVEGLGRMIELIRELLGAWAQAAEEVGGAHPAAQAV